MSDFYTSLSVLILLSSFILMANKRIISYIKTFRMQSLLIAIAAGVMGIESIQKEGRFDVLIVCLAIILLKVYYIPHLLSNTYANVKYKVEKDFILNIPILVIICFGLVVLSYFSVAAIEGVTEGVNNIQIVNSISIILIGMFFMISRRKAIGQIIGFLVIENGIFVMALFSSQGMPFIVDMGIFIDMITAVLIMSIMVFKINEKFESIDTDKLTHLKG